ncbi:MAG: sulfotransferase [Anaerolineae bacterium]|nr:sulfotransferase [Anaerolineae bacterium]
MSLKHSHLPLFTRLLNGIGQSLRALKIPLYELNADALCESAMKHRKLSDFGDPAFYEGLHCLLDSLNKEAHLNVLGRMFVTKTLVALLENRLLLTEDRKRRPDVYERRLLPPIIVTGLPRSGTTLLHRLLATDPAHRAIPFWETMHPLPYSEPDGRFERVKKLLDYRVRLTPDLDGKHFIRAETPEECIFLQGTTFVSTMFWIGLPVFGYVRWYNTAPRRQSYREYSWLLQALQAVTPTKRLALKAPPHMGALDTLYEVLPNARVVQIVRDPVKSTISLNSLLYTSHSVLTKKLDVPRMAQITLEMLECDVKHNLSFRASNPDRICDIAYTDLVADPVTTVQRIYHYFNMPWSEEHSRHVQEYISRHPKGQHGRHHYRAEDFGLTDAAIADRLGDYMDYFGLARNDA